MKTPPPPVVAVHTCEKPLLSVGDSFNIVDWRTNRPYGLDLVERLRMQDSGGEMIDVSSFCVLCAHPQHELVIVGAQHTWNFRRRDWGRWIIAVLRRAEPEC